MAAKIGLGRIEPDETRCITILFDREYAISFVPDAAEEVVYFQCEISDASLLDDGCFRGLLEASLADTNGAAFSIDAALGKVVLWKRFGEFASCAALEKAIDEFLGQVVRWERKTREP